MTTPLHQLIMTNVGAERKMAVQKNGTIVAPWTWVDENGVPHTATSRWSSIDVLFALGRK